MGVLLQLLQFRSLIYGCPIFFITGSTPTGGSHSHSISSTGSHQHSIGTAGSGNSFSEAQPSIVFNVEMKYQ